MASPCVSSNRAESWGKYLPILFVAVLSTVGIAADHDVNATAPGKIGTALETTVPGATVSPGSFRGWSDVGSDPESFHQLFSRSELWDCSTADVVNQYDVVATQLRQLPRDAAARVGYETQNKGLAAKQLTAAIHTGSPVAVASVALKFRFTEAGNRATAMAMLAALDRGYDLSAAFFFNGWFADNADVFCSNKPTHRLVLKGLTLLKTTGLDEEFSSVRKQVETCPTFSAGGVSLEQFDSHFKNVAVEGTQSRLNKEWFEKPTESVKMVEMRRNLLKLALTYGATGPRVKELFKPYGAGPTQPEFAFCDHYDWATTYRQLFAEDSTSSMPFVQSHYPSTTRALNREIKGEVLAEFFAKRGHSDSEIEMVSLLGAVAVPDLIAVLQKGKEAEQFTALKVLAHLGPEAATATPAVTALAEQGSVDAIVTLGSLGQPGAVEIERILKGNSRSLYDLKDSLHLSSETLAVMLARYDGADDGERISILTALMRHGEKAGFAVDRLIEALDSETNLEREYAIGVIGAIGPAAEKAVPKLIEILKESDPNRQLTLTVFSALASMGDKALPALEIVLAYLPDHSSYGDEAERVLSGFGAPVIPALQTILKRSEEGMVAKDAQRLQTSQIRAIKILAYAGDSAVAVLAHALTHSNEPTANEAANALGRLGERAAPAIPALYAAMLSSDSISPRDAGQNLGKVGEAAKPTIIEALASSNSRGRAGATYALLPFSEQPGFWFQPLRHGLKDGDPAVKEAALNLYSSGFALPEVEFPTVVSLTSDDSGLVRLRAYQVLARIPTNASALAIAKGISDEKEDVREFAYYAIRQLGEFKELALPAITGRLHSEKPTHRIEAATYLGKYGPQSARGLLEQQSSLETDPEVKRVILDMVDELRFRKRGK